MQTTGILESHFRQFFSQSCLHQAIGKNYTCVDIVVSESKKVECHYENFTAVTYMSIINS